MLFWLTAAILTLAACLAVLLPMTRAARPAAAAREHDLEVYRDQLAEVDRDEARGLIGPAEAEQARTEIGRRILRLDAGGGNTRIGGGRMARWAGLAAVLAVPVISWGIYAALGSPNLPSQPLAERLAREPAQGTLAELVARAEAHLAANPSDGRGWEVVAPIYLRMGRGEDALRAYRNAIRLLGTSAEREAGLREAMAAGTTAEERSAMIDGMVASLDERLRQNPRDAEGWKRLIRSYVVLGKSEQARDALARGTKAFGAETPEAGELQAFAASLGMGPDTQ